MLFFIVDNCFINLSQLNKSQIIEILSYEIDSNCLRGKNIGLLFEKKSTRTRLSFSVAINNLGGNHIDLKFEDLNFSRGESFEDTFKAMGCYLDGLVYRTTNHDHLINASKYFSKPIINALSDISHPCQILSDLLTIKDYFGSLNCHILWVGDMNNVFYSLLEAANLFTEIKLTVYTPIAISSKKRWKFNFNTSIVANLKDVDLNSVNCVMTDVFISMNDTHSDEKKDMLKPFIVDEKLMNKTAENSIFMHCLPAKVGYEVTEEVFRGPKSIVWKQAYNRMVAQKKLLQFIYQ